MSTVAERVKETFENAKTQVNGFEKDLNKKIAKLARKSAYKAATRQAARRQ